MPAPGARSDGLFPSGTRVRGRRGGRHAGRDGPRAGSAAAEAGRAAPPTSGGESGHGAHHHQPVPAAGSARRPRGVERAPGGAGGSVGAGASRFARRARVLGRRGQRRRWGRRRSEGRRGRWPPTRDGAAGARRGSCGSHPGRRPPRLWPPAASASGASAGFGARGRAPALPTRALPPLPRGCAGARAGAGRSFRTAAGRAALRVGGAASVRGRAHSAGRRRDAGVPGSGRAGEGLRAAAGDGLTGRGRGPGRLRTGGSAARLRVEDRTPARNVGAAPCPSGPRPTRGPLKRAECGVPRVVPAPAGGKGDLSVAPAKPRESVISGTARKSDLRVLSQLGAAAPSALIKHRFAPETCPEFFPAVGLGPHPTQPHLHSQTPSFGAEHGAS